MTVAVAMTTTTIAATRPITRLRLTPPDDVTPAARLRAICVGEDTALDGEGDAADADGDGDWDRGAAPIALGWDGAVRGG